MSDTISLVSIDRDGTPRGYEGPQSEAIVGVLRATAELYESVGFEQPWVGYLALDGSIPVGTCAFKSPPCDGRAEIAYATFTSFEGRGFATAMAAELLELARRHDPTVIVTAQTLPQRNASHRVLEKLGFSHVATLEHPEDGTVWEWQCST